MTMETVPREYATGMFFNKIRQRFQLCGVRPQPDGKFLVMKCLGCGVELSYDWLLKQPDQEWISSDYSKRLKQNLLTIRTHRKCKLIIAQKTALELDNHVASANIISSSPSPAPTVIVNNVFVNLPAVTRIGMAGDSLLCIDIPYPDEKTVNKLLQDPESAIPKFVYKHYFTSTQPSISAPDPTNTKLKVVQRDKHGNRWVDAPLDKTIDNIVYHTLDTLDDEFEALKNPQFKDWKQREGLTAHVGFDRTEAYQKLQNDVTDVIKTHGVPYQN